MITAFGKFLRNLRMDIGELLLQMAEKAHLQEAFYDTNNSVEIGLGKLQIPRRNLVSTIRQMLAEYRYPTRRQEPMK